MGEEQVLEARNQTYKIFQNIVKINLYGMLTYAKNGDIFSFPLR
mgnify:CR=1 FL=1